jgi:arginase
VIIAARDLDQGERAYLRNDPDAPRVFSMQEIDRRGIASIADEAIEICSGAAFTHVSLDLDAVDPRDAPGVGTPVRGGLNYREAHTLLEIISTANPDSVDVVEVNPVLDVRNKTAETAAELVCSLFGASII